jgi:tetratricopeptide (TPR) repeat protein
MIFKSGGAADCDGLINYFTGRIKEAPDDIELLKKVLSLLDDASCTESDLYFAAAESLYEHEKSATSAAHLAQMNFDRGQLARAEHYFKEAISLEEESTRKSSYYTKLAAIRLNEKDNRAARDYARQAIELNPESGTPYMIIGNAYAGQKISDDEFENQAVYWVAVDYFQKAKQVDPSLASNVNEYISTYSGIFPTKTECFFRSITEEGDAYKVGGWINETTTVRFRKES